MNISDKIEEYKRRVEKIKEKNLGISEEAIEYLAKKRCNLVSLHTIPKKIFWELVEKNLIYNYSDLERNKSIYPKNYKKLLVIDTPLLINGKYTKRFRTIFKRPAPKEVGEKILSEFFNLVFTDLIEHGGKFTLPTRFQSILCVRAMCNKTVIAKRKSYAYQNVDMSKTKNKMYSFELRCKYENKKYKYPLEKVFMVKVSKIMYDKLVAKLNSGDINYFNYKEFENDYTLADGTVFKKEKTKRKFDINYSKNNNSIKKLITLQDKIAIQENNSELFHFEEEDIQDKYIEYYAKKLHKIHHFYILNYAKLVKFLIVALNNLYRIIIKDKPLFYQTDYFQFKIVRWKSKRAYNEMKKQSYMRKAKLIQKYAKDTNTKYV